MASPTPKYRAQARKTSGRLHQQTTPTDTPPEVVDPIWLIKAIGVTIVAALICGYLTLCLLFYQGQWQLVLHPSRVSIAPTDIAGASFQIIHFGVDETASPQLTGWLVPAERAAKYSVYTVLYLPSGDGSLTSAIPTLSTLHEMGINVFAFDYRGFGQSAATHPNQQKMAEDAASAWQYLTVSRSLPSAHIVLFGDGVGCSLAAKLAASHPEAPALVLEFPRPEVIEIVLADSRTKSLPTRLLFHEAFAIAGSISNLKTPKLFLLPDHSNDPAATSGAVQRLTSSAPAPKTVTTLPAADFNGPLYREQLLRFFDQYLH